MGYGHLRAAVPLKPIAHEGIITLGENDGSTPGERRLWNKFQGLYSRFSRAKGIPVIGKYIFKILDRFQYIPSFYPVRNLSKSTFQVSLLSSLIDKGLCAGLLGTMERNPFPLVTSFYAPAIAAEMRGTQPVYCIICDADLNRVWVSKEPWESRITYFAPCGRAAQRLQAYGVPQNRIMLTGFPLPDELLGGKDLSVLKLDLAQRLRSLDPNRRFWPLHRNTVEGFLGKEACDSVSQRPLTLTYAVGGAGAQREIGRKIALSHRKRIGLGELKLNLVAGQSESVKEYFDEVLHEFGDEGSRGVRIIYGKTFDEYYARFNEALRTTDILWTKPSELSFYCALGLPIIISPVIGSQEYFNRKWLLEIQAGFRQEQPDYSDQWLFDLLRNGRLAEAAWSGFLKARKLGTYRIMEIIREGKIDQDDSPLLR